MSICSYFPACNACSDWNISYAEQRRRKVEHLSELLESKNLKFSQIDFISAGEHSLRHKTDFVYQHKDDRSHFGFYTKNRDVLDISHCLQMSAELRSVFDEFRKIKIQTQDGPILKGSVRLRISPEGKKGCWLDFSNADIKKLLDDGIYFHHLLNSGYTIEIGQKNKRLVLDDKAQLKLKNLPPEIWFQSINRENKKLPLHCHISSFTQPSWTTGALLIQSVFNWIGKDSPQHILEFGAGVGFFTSAFIADGHKVTALELEESANECLIANSSITDNPDSLHIRIGDYHRKSLDDEIKIYDLAFVNPARAGLKKFTQTLNEMSLNKLIYVSCFPESMTDDLKALENNYKLRNIIIVDQFPQTPHYETCALLEKI